jgi:hypothetical protein
METIDHILAECPVTREIWFLILSALHVTCPPAEITTINWWRRLRGLFVGERKKGLDFLFALVSWQIWKERNARCFRDVATSMADLQQIIRAEADRWILTGAKGLRALAQS